MGGEWSGGVLGEPVSRVGKGINRGGRSGQGEEGSRRVRGQREVGLGAAAARPRGRAGASRG